VLDGHAARGKGLLKTRQLLEVLHRWMTYLLVEPGYELQEEELAELHKETVPPPRQTDEVKREGGRGGHGSCRFSSVLQTSFTSCAEGLRSCGRRLLSQCGGGQFAC